jgi:hypothetical protein
MRFYAGFILAASFLAWVLYRLIIKKDLMKHKTEIKAGVFVMLVWGLIYYAIFS